MINRTDVIVSNPTSVESLPTTGASPGTRIRVDAGAQVKRVDRAASGSLYGIADPERPGPDHLAALRPKNFTQMCPGGEQVPNNEAGPSGDALVVAPLAAAVGATVTVRLADTYPDFPYRWVSWEDWESRVRAAVTAARDARLPNLYAHEVWNEPNWTWIDAVAGSFDEFWARTCGVIREIDPVAPIMGPSIDRWDAEWMRSFLAAAVESGTVPDVVSWHELDPADTDVVAHMAAYREIEDELGLGRLPVSINEYGPHRDMAVPGALVTWVAQLERAGVDTANIAFWHRPGRLADLVTADGRPTGAWWVFRWYGQLSGWMAGVDAGRGAHDAFAAADTAGLDVVVGGGEGDVTLEIVGVDVPDGAQRVWVETERVWWTGTDGPLDEAEAWFAGWVPVSGGTISVTLRDTMAHAAYRVQVRTVAPATPPVSIRAEADLGAVSGRVEHDERASGHRFLTGDAGAGWSTRVERRLLGAGPVDLEVRFRNRSPVPASIGLRDGERTIRTIDVPAGPDSSFRTLSVTLGAEIADALFLTSDDDGLDLDHVDVRPFRRRCEAEDGDIVRGSVQIVDRSPAAFRAETHSGRGHVVYLDEIGSSVEVSVDVPRSGRYRVTLGYTNGGLTSQQSIWVDAVKQATVAAVPTQAWGLVGTVGTEVELPAGHRRIRVVREGRVGHVTLDFIDVEAC